MINDFREKIYSHDAYELWKDLRHISIYPEEDSAGLIKSVEDDLKYIYGDNYMDRLYPNNRSYRNMKESFYNPWYVILMILESRKGKVPYLFLVQYSLKGFTKEKVNIGIKTMEIVGKNLKENNKEIDPQILWKKDKYSDKIRMGDFVFKKIEYIPRKSKDNYKTLEEVVQLMKDGVLD